MKPSEVTALRERWIAGEILESRYIGESFYNWVAYEPYLTIFSEPLWNEQSIEFRIQPSNLWVALGPEKHMATWGRSEDDAIRMFQAICGSPRFKTYKLS